MNAELRRAFDREIALGKEYMSGGDLDRAFGHLERAHVLGQRYVGPHVKAHWLMLKLELGRGRIGAVFGQLARIVLGALGSAIGVVPTGNTGGTDISMFKRLPIAPDLQREIESWHPRQERQ